MARLMADVPQTTEISVGSDDKIMLLLIFYISLIQTNAQEQSDCWILCNFIWKHIHIDQQLCLLCLHISNSVINTLLSVLIRYFT